MEKDSSHGLMEEPTRESTMMTGNRAMVYSAGPMARSTKGSGTTVNNTAREP